MDFDFKVVGFSLTNCGPFRQTEIMPIDELFTFVIGKNNTGKSWVLRGLAMRDLKGHACEKPSTPELTLLLRAGSKPKAIELLKHNDGIRTSSALWPTPLQLDEQHARAQFWQALNNSDLPLEVAITKAQNNKVSIELALKPYEAKRSISRNDRHVHENLEGEATKSFSFFRYFDFRTTQFATSPDSGLEQLDQSGENLPTALAQKQANPEKYRLYMNFVHRVLPELSWVSAKTANGQAHLSARFEQPSSDGDDTLIPLADCGAGVGHVLAILYVVFYERNKIILIDEPQAYLHPSACRELIKVLRELRTNGHQYIIATHSTAILSEGLPATVIQVEREVDTSILRASSRSTINEALNDLASVGAKWSDVFAPDEIAWVEGETEAHCLPLVMMHFFGRAGVTFIPLVQTGDLYDGGTRPQSIQQARRSRAELARDMYQKFSKQLSLASSNFHIWLDKEGLSDAEQADFKSKIGLSLKFFPFTMFEDTLLHPQAIANVLRRDLQLDEKLVLAKVTEALEQRTQNPTPEKSAEFLAELFADISGTTVRYDKIRHGKELTAYLLKHEPANFAELRAFLAKELRLI